MRSRQKRSYFSAKSSKILGVLCALCGEKVFLQWSHRYKNLKDAFIKRFSWLSHLVLGFTDGLAPAGAWAAIRGSLFQASDAPPWVLTFIITFWIGGFDLIYACQDYESDRAIGLHSFPARAGRTSLRLAD